MSTTLHTIDILSHKEAMVQTNTLHDFERQAWSHRAALYDRVFTPVSAQAIDYILNSLGPLEGCRHLDVACGTGHLVAAAMARGAESEGVDFARPMIDVARDSYPRAQFQVADATELPYHDDVFDFLTCAFGLSHMARPGAAVEEIYRVLRPGGEFVFTLWYGPDDGNEVFAIIQATFDRFVEETPAAPHGWPQLRYADEALCKGIAEKIGFTTPSFEKIPIVYHMSSGQDMIKLLETLSTRSKFILESQPHSTQERIRSRIVAETDSRRSEHGVTLAFPAMLASARKPR